MSTDPSPWLTYKEAADLLGCSTKTLQRSVKRGELTAYRADGKSFVFRRIEVEALSRPVPIGEVWVPVKGYEGLYEVSNRGKVRSLHKLGKTHELKPQIHTGYPQVTLHKNKVGKKVGIHVLMAYAFHGDPLPGQEVCHNNGIKTDLRIENIRWGTCKENRADRSQHDTYPRADGDDQQ